MKKNLCVIATAGLLLSGCSFVTSPVSGAFYTDVKTPVLIADGKVSPNAKVGEATCKVIFGVAVGDCSIETAAKNGNISKVQAIDSETFNVLWVYGTYKVKVVGE